MGRHIVVTFAVLAALAVAGPLPSAFADTTLPAQPVRTAVTAVRQAPAVETVTHAARPVTSHPAVEQVREPVQQAATQAAATVQQTRETVQAAVAPRPTPR